jgi:hypothetical protein
VADRLAVIPGVITMALSRQTNIVIPQKHSDMLVAAWHSQQLAERFRQAMRRARSELGPGGKFGAVLKRAWALDPDLRERFGDAISMGLRGMWASDVLRAEQSERIKQTYTQDLRKQRSETLKANWADADFREKMLRARAVPADDHDRRRRRDAADTTNRRCS